MPYARKGMVIVMTKYINKCNISIFLLLFLTSSFTVCNSFVPSTITYILWIVPVAFVALKLINMDFERNLFYVVLFLCFNRVLTTMITGENMAVCKSNLISIFVTFVILQNYDLKDILKGFTNVMKFLCVVSLVCYLISLIDKNILGSINQSVLYGRKFYNLIIAVGRLDKSLSFPRNMGMFWEPGAFQTFIIFAMIIDIFMLNNQSTKTLALYSATVFTTFSTTGYIALVVIYLVIISDNKKISFKTKFGLCLLLGAAIVIIVLNQSIFFETSYSSVFGKLFRLAESGKSAEHSEGVRLASITEPLKQWLKSPVWGVGRTYLMMYLLNTKSNGMATCTFVNWFAVYGTLYGVVMMIGLMKFSKSVSSKSLIKFIGIFAALMITIISENYVDNAAVTMIPLMGYLSRMKSIGEV